MRERERKRERGRGRGEEGVLGARKGVERFSLSTMSRLARKPTSRRLRHFLEKPGQNLTVLR